MLRLMGDVGDVLLQNSPSFRVENKENDRRFFVARSKEEHLIFSPHLMSLALMLMLKDSPKQNQLLPLRSGFLPEGRSSPGHRVKAFSEERCLTQLGIRPVSSLLCK